MQKIVSLSHRCWAKYRLPFPWLVWFVRRSIGNAELHWNAIQHIPEQRRGGYGFVSIGTFFPCWRRNVKCLLSSWRFSLLSCCFELFKNEIFIYILMDTKMPVLVEIHSVQWIQNGASRSVLRISSLNSGNSSNENNERWRRHQNKHWSLKSKMSKLKSNHNPGDVSEYLLFDFDSMSRSVLRISSLNSGNSSNNSNERWRRHQNKNL